VLFRHQTFRIGTFLAFILLMAMALARLCCWYTCGADVNAWCANRIDWIQAGPLCVQFACLCCRGVPVLQQVITCMTCYMSRQLAHLWGICVYRCWINDCMSMMSVFQREQRECVYPLCHITTHARVTEHVASSRLLLGSEVTCYS
jgi:hypothetical protein